MSRTETDADIPRCAEGNELVCATKEARASSGSRAVSHDQEVKADTERMTRKCNAMAKVASQERREMNGSDTKERRQGQLQLWKMRRVTMKGGALKRKRKAQRRLEHGKAVCGRCFCCCGG
ncbi:hypothetical protein TRVL_08991 [Trypanosoma vivax]|nr:hypothetical protein TRVL_08991 [Trypanosoma vivax]